jgi:hypothetical protein
MHDFKRIYRCDVMVIAKPRVSEEVADKIIIKIELICQL